LTSYLFRFLLEENFQQGQQVFFTLADVRDKLEHWRQDYNQVRPHSALADHPPETFAAQWAETAAPGPEPVPAPTGKPAAGKLLEILN
jgi:hypothetical protein